MSTRATAPAGSVQVGYLDGSMAGIVKVGDVAVQVQRRFWFDRDINGPWGVFVETGDSPFSTPVTPTGTIRAGDPVVCPFLDTLAVLFAHPDAFAR